MKRMIFVLLLSILPPLVLAQSGKAVQTGVKLATQSDIALRVAQQTARQSLSRTPALAQITNWTGKPLVRVQQAGNVSIPASDDLSPVAVRVPDWQTTARYLFPEGRQGHKAHIPSAFEKRQGAAFYRGLSLRRLDELKNLLVNGMERDKVSAYFPGIFAADEAKMALGYATPWGALYPSLPVIVRIPDTPELAAENIWEKKTPFSGVFRQDVKPRFISDVMVFLEVNGKPGWHKVMLVDEEMVFIPVLGTTLSW